MRPLSRPAFRSFLALLALAGAASAQTTFYVDDNGSGDPFPGVSVPGNPAFSDPLEDGSPEHPFDDLYKAVDAAVNGDTVLVLPSDVIGSYALSSTLDLDGKAITVTSSGGPLVTALDGSGIVGSSGVRIDSGEGPATVLEGFTIQNCDRGSVIGDLGGGLFIQGASPTIRNCRFTGNHAYDGGGVYARDSSALYEDCLFLANTASIGGAGAFSATGSPTYLRCTFDSNVADRGAGALTRSALGDSMRFTECLFVDNEATGNWGGGLGKLDAGQLEVERSRFVGNVALDQGGAVYADRSAFIHDSLFNGNSAAIGAIYKPAGSGTLDIFGCTLVHNTGGAVQNLSGSPCLLRNSVSWNNAVFEVGGGVVATYCNVLGGKTGVGNIDVDPRFVDAFGPDGVLGTLDDDLRLRKNSPCIDAADTLELHKGPSWANSILVAYPADLDGAPRAVDAPARPDTGVPSLGQTTDMGAYEFQPAKRDCNAVVNLGSYP